MKKVICIASHNTALTLGKYYELNTDHPVEGQLFVRNDNGWFVYYPIWRFKQLDEIREEKLNIILDK